MGRDAWRPALFFLAVGNRPRLLDVFNRREVYYVY